jgi:hypothetical protein
MSSLFALKTLLNAGFSENRTYALDKLLMVCIHENRSFQALVNHSLMGHKPALWRAQQQGYFILFLERFLRILLGQTII